MVSKAMAKADTGPLSRDEINLGVRTAWTGSFGCLFYNLVWVLYPCHVTVDSCSSSVVWFGWSVGDLVVTGTIPYWNIQNLATVIPMQSSHVQGTVGIYMVKGFRLNFSRLSKAAGYAL